MTPPTSLLPNRLGLRWGASRDECVALLGTTPWKESAAFAVVAVPVDGSEQTIRLQFDASGGLHRVDLDACVSRDFCDDYDPKEYDEIRAHFRSRYRAVRDEVAASLGPPDYEGGGAKTATQKNRLPRSSRTGTVQKAASRSSTIIQRKRCRS
jgi:hypothetical protein